MSLESISVLNYPQRDLKCSIFVLFNIFHYFVFCRHLYSSLLNVCKSLCVCCIMADFMHDVCGYNNITLPSYVLETIYLYIYIRTCQYTSLTWKYFELKMIWLSLQRISAPEKLLKITSSTFDITVISNPTKSW